MTTGTVFTLPPPPINTQVTDEGSRYFTQPWADWFYRLTLLLQEALPESQQSNAVTQSMGVKIDPSAFLHGPGNSITLDAVKAFMVPRGVSPWVFDDRADQGILASQIFGY